jgi:hypothetical protein
MHKKLLIVSRKSKVLALNNGVLALVPTTISIRAEYQ